MDQNSMLNQLKDALQFILYDEMLSLENIKELNPLQHSILPIPLFEVKLYLNIFKNTKIHNLFKFYIFIKLLKNIK